MIARCKLTEGELNDPCIDLRYKSAGISPPALTRDENPSSLLVKYRYYTEYACRLSYVDAYNFEDGNGQSFKI